MLIIVFNVNMLSPRKYQVKIGNIKYDRDAAKNLTDHRLSSDIYAYFVPCQNSKPAGIPKTIVDKRALFFQYSHTSCIFPANHPKI